MRVSVRGRRPGRSVENSDSREHAVAAKGGLGKGRRPKLEVGGKSMSRCHSTTQAGKRFYCREWAFAKIHHCLETRQSSKTCGALIMGGPGSGKTVLCSEIVWPTSSHGRQRVLGRCLLAHHFCRAHDVDTLSVSGFIGTLVSQLRRSELVPGYAAKLDEPEVRAALDEAECGSRPDEAFKRAVLFPLLELDPPNHACFVLVDSIDETYLAAAAIEPEGGGGGSESVVEGGSRTIAELLANHHQLFPQWLLLFCSSRKQSKSVNKLFTGFRKISLDDLHKTHVVRDVQQYILSRLDQEESLRRHLSRETADMLNRLHIKSNGCFLYLETVLDGVIDGFVVLRDIRDIPGTLNGLYLWLCQRLFGRKQFSKVRPLLNALLASRRPVALDDLYACAAIGSSPSPLSADEFDGRVRMLGKLVLDGRPAGTKVIFHHSFAEWLVDVKHCTPKYLCSVAEGHALLAACHTLRSVRLTPVEIRDFAWHLGRFARDKSWDESLLSLWMVYSGARTEDVVLLSSQEPDPKTEWLLLEAGAKRGGDRRTGSPPPPGRETTAACIGTEPESSLSNEDDGKNEEDGADETLEKLEKEDDERTVDESSSSPTVVDENRRTMLHRAAHDGDARLVRLSIERGLGVTLEAADATGQTALNLAARRGHVECVGLLLEAGANADNADDDKRTALRAAAWSGNEEIVSRLIEFGASVDLVDAEGRTALIAAAYMGHANVVDVLLENGADANHRDHDGMTALLIGAFEGHRRVCELLLEYDADVDHVDPNGRSALLAAASMGHADIVDLLLFFGAAIDAIDAEGRTVLSVSASQGNVDVVRQLLDRGLDEMHKCNSGWTPLHYAAFEGHVDVCEALLDAGSRIDETDNDGKHALVLAAHEGHAEAVVALADRGAAIDHRSHDGRTAFRVAALEGHRDVVTFLMERGADVDYVDADGRSTLYLLALENRVDMAAFLLERGGVRIDGVDLGGRGPLHVAAWQNDASMVELLLDHGATVDATDLEGRTPLQLACWQGKTDLVKRLLERGAAVDHACNQGATGLCIAAQEGHESVVRILLEAGADAGHADQFGRSPIRVATKCGHANVVRLIEDYGVSTRFPGSQSTTSMASCSTTETKPCSAILCPPGFDSPAVSPGSTYDKRRSCVSTDPSSSSSSSGGGAGNLTTSTRSSRRVAVTSTTTDPVAGCVASQVSSSFARQLRQCSRQRNRPASRVLLPSSPPFASPGDEPQTPPTVVDVARPTLGFRCLSPIAHGSSPRNSDSVPPPPPRSSSEAVCHPPTSSFPWVVGEAAASSRLVSPSSVAYSPEARLRRNGIVTNPNCKGGGSPNLHGKSACSTAVDASNVNGHRRATPDVRVAYERRLETIACDRALVSGPNVVVSPLKRETPL